MVVLLRDRLLARLRTMGAAPDYRRLAAEVLGISNAPEALARRLVEQALVLEDRRDTWLRTGERICERAPQGPGVYVLSATGPVDAAGVSTEYHAPPPDSLPPSVQALAAPAYLVGRASELGARVVDRTAPDSATLFIRPTAGGFYRGFAMRPAGPYEYVASVPAAALREGPNEFVITLFHGDSAVTFPDGLRAKPTDWDYYSRGSWKLDVVAARTPLRLFTPRADAPRLTFTRIGDAGRRGLFRLALSDVTGEPVFHLELPVDASGWSPPDYTASLVIQGRIRSRQEAIGTADGVRLRLRGLGARQVLHISLMEDDGTTWSAAVPVDQDTSNRASTNAFDRSQAAE